MRRGVTLVELLVAIAIIIALAGLVLLFWPRREVRTVNDATVNVQTYIASAKALALREQRPVGVRLITEDGGKTYTSLVMLDPGDRIAPIQPNMALPSANWTIYLDLRAGSTITTPAENTARQVGYPLAGRVAVGDFLEIVEVTPSIHRIVAIDYATDTVTLAGLQEVDSNGTPYVAGVPNVNSIGAARLGNNYRYLRSPRPLLGEQPHQLPRDVVIMGQSLTGAVPTSLNLPVGSTGEVDLIFAPSGQMINARAGRVVLWIQDTNGAAKPDLLCIYTATGGIASHPVGPAGSEFDFTQDGKGSGH